MRLALFSILLFLGCEEKSSNPSTSDYANAIQLAAGNTWKFDVEIRNIETDSIISSSEEHINIFAMSANESDNCDKGGTGTPYEMTSTYNFFFNRTVKDSLGHLVDCRNGNIMFAGVESDTIIFEHERQLIRMTNIDSVITVPAGTFKTINYQ